MWEKGKEVMQIRKERKKGRGKGQDREQADTIPFRPSQNNQSRGNLVQAEETELLGSTHRNSPGCQKTSHQSSDRSGSPTLR